MSDQTFTKTQFDGDSGRSSRHPEARRAEGSPSFEILSAINLGETRRTPPSVGERCAQNDAELAAVLSRSILYQALAFFFRRPDPNQDFSSLKWNRTGSVSPMSFPRKRESRTLDPRFRRANRAPYRPYGTARPSARPALVQAAVPYDRAPDRRLTKRRGGDTSYETASGRIWQEAVDTVSTHDPGKLKKLLDSLLMELKNTTSEEWANEYEKLLGHTVNGIAPAYELEYGEAHTHREPQQLADIAAFYSAFGLRLSDRSHERADHASVELEFMYFLLYKEAIAMGNGEEEKGQICREASHRFLSEHLGYWFPAFVLRLSKHSEGILKSVAGFAFEFVVQDCLAQSIRPGPEDLPIRAIQEKIESSCVSCEFARPVVPLTPPSPPSRGRG